MKININFDFNCKKENCKFDSKKSAKNKLYAWDKINELF
jgi:hypothetical protein